MGLQAGSDSQSGHGGGGGDGGLVGGPNDECVSYQVGKLCEEVFLRGSKILKIDALIYFSCGAENGAQVEHGYVVPDTVVQIGESVSFIVDSR